MFGSGLLESQTQSATEPDTDIRAFQLFLDWLYRDKVSCDIAATADCALSEVDKVRVLFYALADKYMIDGAVKTEMVRQILHGRAHDEPNEAGRYPRTHPELLPLVLRVTTTDDPLRMVILDIVGRDLLRQNDTSWMDEMIENLEANDLRVFVRYLNGDMRRHESLELKERVETMTHYMARAAENPGRNTRYYHENGEPQETPIV